MPDIDDNSQEPSWWPMLKRASLAATLSIGIVWFALELVLKLPGLPYNVEELFVADHPHLSVLAFACFLVWSALAPLLAATMVRRRMSSALTIGPLAVFISLLAYFFLRFSVTEESIRDILGSRKWNLGADWEYILRFLSLHGGAIILMTVGAVAALRRQTVEGHRPDRVSSLRVLAVALPVLALCRYVVIHLASTDNLVELIEPDLPLPGDLFILGALLLTAWAGYRWIRVMRRPSSRRAIGCAAFSMAVSGTSLLLVKTGLNDAVYKPMLGGRFSAFRFLLAAHRHADVSDVQLALRFVVLNLAAMGLLAAAAWLFTRIEPLLKGGAVALSEKPSDGVVSRRIGPAALSPEARPGRFCRIALVIYVFLLLYGYLVPFEFRDITLTEALREYGEVVTRTDIRSPRSDIVTNILIYIPMTFLAMGAITREGARQRGWPLKALLVVAVGLAWSFFLEFLQMFVHRRTSSLHDVVSMTIGGIIGIGLWLVFGIVIVAWARGVIHRRVPARHADQILIGYAVASVLYQSMPFYPTIRITEIYRRYRTGAINFMPLREWFGPLTSDAIASYRLLELLYTAASKTLVAVPIGYLFYLLVRKAHQAVWRAIGWGLVFALGLEMLHAVIPGRIASATDIVYGTLGAALGVYLARRFGPAAVRPAVYGRHWTRYGPAYMAAALVALFWGLALFKWYPYDFNWPGQGIGQALLEAWRVPFFHQYYQKGSVNLGAQMVREIVWFAMLGMLVQALVFKGAGRPMRRLTYPLMVLPALLLEGGQIVFGKTPDFTILAVEIAAGLVGVWFYPWFVLIFVLPASKNDNTDGLRVVH